MTKLFTKLSFVVLIVFAVSCSNNSSNSSSSNNGDNSSNDKTVGYTAADIAGNWAYETTCFFDGSEFEEEGSLDFYKDGSFKYTNTIKDNEDDLVAFVSVGGSYTVDNNTINYKFKDDNFYVGIGLKYSNEDELYIDADEYEDNFKKVLRKGDKIISIDDDGDKLVLKDSEDEIYTFERN